MKKTYYNQNQLAKKVGVSRQAVCDMVRRGKLIPSSFDGNGKPLFDEATALKYLSDRERRFTE